MAFAMKSLAQAGFAAHGKPSLRSSRMSSSRPVRFASYRPSRIGTSHPSQKEESSMLPLKIAGAVLAASLTFLPVGPVLANDYIDAVKELEEILPVAEEALTTIAAKAGAEEVKEIVAEIKEIEASVLKLEKAEEAVGGEASTEIEVAAKPLVQQLTELKNLLNLFGK